MVVLLLIAMVSMWTTMMYSEIKIKDKKKGMIFMFCPNCGKENEDTAVFCSECQSKFDDIEQKNQDNKQIAKNYATDNANTYNNVLSMMPLMQASGDEQKKTRRAIITGTIIITIVLIFNILISLINKYVIPEQFYEYTTVTFYAEEKSRTGSGASEYTTVYISEERLDMLGLEGWEVVGSYLEMETAYPNFGDSNYVTGIQPNVRPQKVVVILKRPIPIVSYIEKSREVGKELTAKSIYDAAFAYQTELIGMNKDYKDTDIIVKALNDKNSSYYLELPEGKELEATSKPSPETYGLDVDKETGKITIYWTSPNDDSIIRSYS